MAFAPWQRRSQRVFDTIRIASLGTQRFLRRLQQARSRPRGYRLRSIGNQVPFRSVERQLFQIVGLEGRARFGRRRGARLGNQLIGNLLSFRRSLGRRASSG